MLNNMHKWPSWLQEVFWTLFNAWIWLKERVRPLNDEQKAANMDDLLNPPQEDTTEAAE